MPATPDLSLQGANGSEAISIQILTTIPRHLPREFFICHRFAEPNKIHEYHKTNKDIIL